MIRALVKQAVLEVSAEAEWYRSARANWSTGQLHAAFSYLPWLSRCEGCRSPLNILLNIESGNLVRVVLVVVYIVPPTLSSITCMQPNWQSVY